MSPSVSNSARGAAGGAVASGLICVLIMAAVGAGMTGSPFDPNVIEFMAMVVPLAILCGALSGGIAGFCRARGRSKLVSVLVGTTICLAALLASFAGTDEGFALVSTFVPVPLFVAALAGSQQPIGTPTNDYVQLARRALASTKGRITIVILGLALIPELCNRFTGIPDYAMDTCMDRNRPRPPGRIEYAAGQTPAGSLIGMVLSEPELHAVSGATVSVSGKGYSYKYIRSDSSGQFRFDSLTSGRYEMSADDIEHWSFRDSVALPLPPGQRMRILLKRSEPFSGVCGMAATLLMQRPWWRFW